MRFAMRSTTTDPVERADLYSATIDMAAWAEGRGCLAAVVSQHHASEDGYLPSPVPMAAAIATRTTTLPISVAALLLALLRADQAGRGPGRRSTSSAAVRVAYIVGIGYRDDEFDMFGVDRRTRARLVEERIGILRRLWSGEPVDIDGRTVAVTPAPFTPGGPTLLYGGGSEPAARRAGRLGMMFMAETSDASLEVAYREAAEAAGVEPLGCFFPQADVPPTVFVADDPDRAWAELGEYMLVDALSYGGWNSHRSGVASVSYATSVEELRSEKGNYQIITPDEAAAYVAQGSPLGLQPLVGGIPPDIAWPYLERAAAVAPSVA